MRKDMNHLRTATRGVTENRNRLVTGIAKILWVLVVVGFRGLPVGDPKQDTPTGGPPRDMSDRTSRYTFLRHYWITDYSISNCYTQIIETVDSRKTATPMF